MPKNNRLNAAQYKRLEQLMRRVQAGGGLNLEQTDGFFAGLICLPAPSEPDEFFDVVFGHDEEEWESAQQEQAAEAANAALPMAGGKLPPVEPTDELVDLLLLLYDSKMTAQKNGIFYSNPLLLPDEEGETAGRDWARGFLDCLAWDGCLDTLEDLIEKDDESDLAMALVPLMALASGVKPANTYEDDESEEAQEPGAIKETAAENRSGASPSDHTPADEAGEDDDDIEYIPLTSVELRDMQEMLPASVNIIYQTLRGIKPPTPQAANRKTPRNAPCACGSGKKYKQCCLLKQ